MVSVISLLLFGEFYSTNGTVAVALEPLGYAVSMKKMLAFKLNCLVSDLHLVKANRALWVFELALIKQTAVILIDNYG